MRMFKVLSAAAIAAVLVCPAAAAQDADKKVAGGGITVKGWMGKEDAGNKQGLTINDSKLAPEGKGMRVVTGPAALYWNPRNVGKGDFSVKATFTEPKQSYDHPHPYGVFIGGANLDTAPTALYCVAYRNGTYIVRGFSGGKPFGIVPKRAPHDAIKKGDPPAEVVQEVAMNVRGDKVECVINGATVWSAAKADVVGEGKLASTDGITGIRVSHNSDAIVTGFAVGK